MQELNGHLLILMITTPFILAAMWSDAKRRKLPTALSIFIAVLAVVLHAVSGGLAGLGSAGAGLVIGFCLLLPFFMFHMVGGGDVKLMAALGAFVGYPWVFPAAAAGVLLGGVCSLFIMLSQKREIAAGRWALIAAKISSLNMLNSDFASHETLSNTRKAIPYGVYLGIGALAVSSYKIYTLMNGV